MCSLLAYHAGVLGGWRDPLIPPKGARSVGGGDFESVGEEFFGSFVELAGLQPHERVLDVGCGTDRMARPLTGYLDERGSYEGFDIVPEEVTWCRRRITPRHPRFRFEVGEIHNTRYNPSARFKASEYRSPLPTSRSTSSS